MESSVAPHQRYQFKPFTGSSHSWALSVMETIPKSARILDVGCGSGAVGRALRERGFTHLDAVEIDDETREKARPTYGQIESSIEPFLARARPAPDTSRFDILLLLDVIEHMAEPERFLRDASELLSPAGKILLSVPNITHWSVRLPMLCGCFNYTERGILDRTHLQFFTTRRVRDIQRHVPSLKLQTQQGSIAPAEFVLPEWISHSSWFEGIRQIRRVGACAWPGLFAFQHLALFERVPVERVSVERAAFE